MKKEPAPKFVTTPLWWRKVSTSVFHTVGRRYRGSNKLLTTTSGMDQEIAASLKATSPRLASRTGGSAKQSRQTALEQLDHKLGAVLHKAVAGKKPPKPTPVRLYPDGSGFSFLDRKVEVKRTDLLEIQFFISAKSPVMIHCYSRVVGLAKDQNSDFVRIDCRYETIFGEGPVKPKKPAPPSEPAKPVQKKISDHLPWKPEPVPAEPVVPKFVSPSEEKPPPLVEKIDPEPEEQPAEPATKWDVLVDKGREIATEARTPDLTGKPDRPRPERRPPGPRRQDFRVNDQIPLGWKVLTRESFDQAVASFKENQSFNPRKIIIKQEHLLARIDEQVEKLKRMRSRARRNVVWFKDRLHELFLRSHITNEEEYFHGLTGLLLEIAVELGNRGGQPNFNLLQIFFHLKEKMELQRERDELALTATLDKREKILDSLRNVNRQIEKGLEAGAEKEIDLIKVYKVFNEGIAAVDVSKWDRSKSSNEGGMAVYPVNLSASGVAFRTRADWLEKEDLLELRMVLSEDGKVFREELCYAKVVVVKDMGGNKPFRIASLLTHISLDQQNLLFAHVARRQREELAKKAKQDAR
ncbi:MAG: PilZ domain-containing protein [Magnetococcales bacterium]|nr:PilZ domain-containing protein [Magnetococcales bacterium]